MSECYRIAIYMRLSKEDEDISNESNSIMNQRMLLKEYVKNHFVQYRLQEFVDDGFSGTNFRRPGIMNMLEQTRDGQIDCVIVKDFSRFSRDYIELGSYLDQIFPFLGVRFISLNDNYDSIDHKGHTAELDVSFKALMYDLYSKDLSVKIKSSLQIRKEQGQYVCGNVPFGYKKDKGDRHKLVIAEDEAEIVRRIFWLTLKRKTSIEIAKMFNQEKVPTPIEYKNKKKQIKRMPLGNRFQWNSSTVCAIIKNPVYVGDMVYDKYYRNDVGGKNRLKPRSEWKIYKDHHAAIIPRNIFDKIQEERKQAKGRNPKSEKKKHPLQGKVICGNCKRAMTLRKRLNSYFYCDKKYVFSDVEECVSNINLMFLEQMVLYRIDSELSRQEMLEQMKAEKEAEIRKKVEKLIKERERLLKRKLLLQRKRFEAYEKSVFNTECKFETDHTAIEQAEAMIGEVEYEIGKLERELPKRQGKFTDLFCGGLGTTLTEELVDKLIDKIVVCDEQHIEIKWRFDEKEIAII